MQCFEFYCRHPQSAQLQAAARQHHIPLSEFAYSFIDYLAAGWGISSERNEASHLNNIQRQMDAVCAALLILQERVNEKDHSTNCDDIVQAVNRYFWKCRNGDLGHTPIFIKPHVWFIAQKMIDLGEMLCKEWIESVEYLKSFHENHGPNYEEYVKLSDDDREKRHKNFMKSKDAHDEYMKLLEEHYKGIDEHKKKYEKFIKWGDAHNKYLEIEGQLVFFLSHIFTLRRNITGLMGIKIRCNGDMWAFYNFISLLKRKLYYEYYLMLRLIYVYNLKETSIIDFLIFLLRGPPNILFAARPPPILLFSLL